MPPKPPAGIRYVVEEREAGDLRAMCVKAVLRDAELGRACATREGDTPWAGVTFAKAHRPRQGVGTKLYERLAREACTRLGVPLASDAYRTHDAQGFWAKQLAKRRATCLQPADPERIDRYATSDESSYGRGRCERYVLTCPAPRSLAGVKRRRR